MCRKRIIRMTAFGIIFLIIFFHISKLLESKSGKELYAPFFDEKEDYDVLFFGSSVTANGISPLDMWKENGICSWNLANNGQTLALNYYCMKNALEFQKPELCVVDLAYLAKVDLVNGEGRMHELLDNMPFYSKERFELLEELVPKEEWGNYIVPLGYYHGRWKELNESDFRDTESLNKGGSIMDLSVKEGVVFDTEAFREGVKLIDQNKTASIPEANVAYCRKMIELCAEWEIEILFVHFPHFISDEYYNGNAERIWAQYNEFHNVIADYENASYVDFNYNTDDIGFDYVKHMCDTTHLNIAGNRKMTSVLGIYIKENYEIPDRRTENKLGSWENDWEKWDTYRNELVKAD